MDFGLTRPDKWHERRVYCRDVRMARVWQVCDLNYCRENSQVDYLDATDLCDERSRDEVVRDLELAMWLDLEVQRNGKRCCYRFTAKGLNLGIRGMTGLGLGRLLGLIFEWRHHLYN